MAEIQCPMDKPICVKDCAWFMGDKCAVVVIAEKLGEGADGIGALNRSKKKAF